MSEITVLFDKKASKNKQGVKVWTIYFVNPIGKNPDSPAKKRQYEKIGIIYKGSKALIPVGQVQSNCNIKLVPMMERNATTGKNKRLVRVSYASGGRELK